MLKKQCLLPLLILWSVCINAQDITTRLQQLNTNNFQLIEQTILNYREQQKSILSDEPPPKLTQLRRQLWWNETRLNEGGEIVNDRLRNWSAYKQFVEQSKTESFASVSPQTAEWSYGSPGNIRNNDGIATGTGRINFVKLDPNDRNNASAAWIYVGAPRGGLWRGTFNKSTGLVPSWTCLTDGLPDIGVVDMAIHPSNRNIIYIVSGDKNSQIGNVPVGIGILKSSDGGESWTPTKFYDDEPPAFSYGTVRKLIMDDSNPLRMWAATTQGIYRTLDGWETFTVEQSGNFWDIEKGRNGSNQNLIACTNSLVYTSADFGASWTAVRNNDNTANYSFTSIRAELAVSADFGSNRSFYLWYVNGAGNEVDNIKLYTGSTSTWSDKYSADLVTTYRDYCMAFEASQSDNRFIYVGGLTLKQSDDNGASYIDINGGVPGGGTFSDNIHADNHYMAWDQGYLFLGNDGGPYNYNYSNGGAGAGWRYLGDGLRISQYYRIGYANNVNGFRALGGAQDMGTHNSSRHFGCCDGMESLVNYNNPDILYYSRQDAIVYRSEDNGFSGADFYPAGFNNTNVWITPMAMHKTNPDYIALAQVDEGDGNKGKIQIYNGSTWSVKATNASAFRWLAFAKSAANVLYGITSSQIVKIDNVTSSTPTVTTYTLPVNGATSVTVDPDNSAHVFYTVGGYGNNKVYESTNSGQIWEDRTLNLPDVPVNVILMNQGVNNDVYIGTDLGVFVWIPGWSYWAPFMNGLPNSPVTDLEIDNGLLTCATYGRGRWVTNLYATCLPELDLTVNNDPSGPVTGYQYYTAQDSISSTRIVQGGAGTNVTYRAGSSIRLADGFHAIEGNEFLATLGPCFPGGPAPLGGIMQQNMVLFEPNIAQEQQEVPVTKKYSYLRPPINW